jgi:hypothetical protein
MAHRFARGNVAAMALLALPMTARAVDFSSLDATFGAQIWVDDNLWDDVDSDVAARLRWRPESRTTTDSSFRHYAGSSERMLGARPFSLAFYGAAGKATEISMVFANKGDAVTGKVNNRTVAEVKKQIAADAREIEVRLTAELGPPKVAQFGTSVRTREQVRRWDWNGHSILLAAPNGEYVAVRIVPTAVADGEAIQRVTGADLQARLKTRIERRPNGDVVLKDIPMVDQGPKGYCVPATWERALRYVGIPADMYVLAMAAQTGTGGGTSLDAMRAAANDIVQRNGRRLVTSGGRLTTESVARFIDKGLPILWGMTVVPTVNESISNRTVQRRTVTDWEAYRQMLKPWRRAAGRIRRDPKNGHMCMIVGYNSGTGEVAISDSWGPQYAERWITEEEANAISDGQFTVVN